MRKDNIRNIVIIAHVDHGKTTLVDGMLKQSGIFRENQQVEDRIMDSMDLEKERGITIAAKNTSVFYKGVKINIVDTPGHADFGGEVERSLNMIDGALLLVDAAEGPLPQTRFVVKKALEKSVPILLVINKIDRKDARIKEVLDEIYDLFIEVEADDNKVPQLLITSLDYDSYVGQISIGRLENGTLEMNKNYSLCGENGISDNVKFSALYKYEGLSKKKVDKVYAGDIIAVAGVENVKIGDTISSSEDPQPLKRFKVDDPTVSMLFFVNNSPFSGKEGDYLTSRHLLDRLEKEMLRNVSIKINKTERADAFEVCGRGELQMAVLIETMRREGYELMVSKPKVILKEKNGKILEPVERIFLDIPEEYIGVITEKLSKRKGKMTNLKNMGNGRVDLEFIIPTRGLIGFASQFLTNTKGAGIMNTFFEGYEPWFGSIPQRTKGALVADRRGRSTTYASFNMVDRGELFIEVGTEVYEGMVIGERNREGDLNVNITKEKKLTNMRAASSDATVVLRPPRPMSLDQTIEFIAEEELVEVTPKSIRIRKMELNCNKRAVAARKEKWD